MGLTRSNPYFSKTLIDAEKGAYVEEWSISSEELGVGAGWSVEKKRLHGGPSDNIDIITVNNGKLSFIVVPTRGMSVWKGECEGNFLGWISPIKELVHPHYMNLEARGGLGWLDGFNEWIVRCGLSSLGAPGPDMIIDNMGRRKDVTLTLHGKIANIPASKVQVRIGLEPPFEICVNGTVYERSMFGPNLALTTSITTTPRSNSLKISDSITNLRGVPDEMQILYHCNYGVPFLEEGARFIAPIKCVSPRDSISSRGIEGFDTFDSPKSGFVEQVYFMELLANKGNHTCVMLVSKGGDKAVSISYLLNELPCFTLWKNTASLEDGYVVGLEPGTSFPNPKSFERKKNRIIKLEPGKQYTAELNFFVHLNRDDVLKIEENICRIAGKVKPKVFREPIGDFSPP